MVELADMLIFVRAIHCGSLSAAGRTLGLSPAVASKRLTRLEARLGVRLVQRTSRQLHLTEAGEAYYGRCQDILAAAEEAEHAVTCGRSTVTGTLRVSAPVALGRRWVGPALAQFADLHPDLHVHLSLEDSIVDLIELGFDCAVRIGGLQDSRLVSRKLADSYRVVCAAPNYLQRFGSPQHPEELALHQAISLGSQRGGFIQWSLKPIAADSRSDEVSKAQIKQVSVPVRWSTNNGEQAHDWALAGLGLVRRSIWDVAEDIASGRLIRVLPEWASESTHLHVIFPSRQFLPAKTRMFIDFLVQRFAAQERLVIPASAV